MTESAESVEAEAARVRSQLVSIGADIRRHADPTVMLDTAKASFDRRSQELPSFLKKNATPIGMLVLGGTFGAVLTGFVAPRRRKANATGEDATLKSETTSSSPGLRAQLKAALISGLGVSLGYTAGLAVPPTSTEERLLGEPKAILSERLDQFLQQHMRGMKHAALSMFGASRLSGTTLVGLAILAELMGTPRRGRTNAP